MTTPPRWILFDIGNVLITLNPWETMIPHAGQTRPDQLGRAVSALRQSALLADFESGQVSFEAFVTGVCALLEREIAAEEIRTHLLKFLGPEKEDVAALVEELRKTSTRVAALTNTNVVHLRALDQYAAVRAMEHVIASCEIGCSKPEARAFERALATLQAKPEETFFVDDQPANVEGARAVGIRGAVFTDATSLRSDLAAVGVEIGERGA